MTGKFFVMHGRQSVTDASVTPNSSGQVVLPAEFLNNTRSASVLLDQISQIVGDEEQLELFENILSHAAGNIEGALLALQNLKGKKYE